MAAAKVLQVPPCVKGKYDVDEEIARGKFGVVYRCHNKKTREKCAVKIMQKKGNKKLDVEKEVDVLKRLDHPTILKIDDYFEGPNEYVLVTELLNGGELFDYVTQKDYLDETEATYYMRQILSGLQYMHSKNIVHLDLKPENVVLKDKDAKQLKIIDFGTAQDLTKNPTIKTMVGTPEFIAPEVLNYDPVTCAADMWAIGIITYVLLTGMSPFLGDNDMETIANIATGEYEFPDPDPEEGYEDISQPAKDFIDSLLMYKPRQRKTAEQCLAEPWLSGDIKGSRISTVRLRNFRARRKWLATLRAVRVSLTLFRSIKRGSDGGMCAISPPPRCPDEVFENGK